MDNGKMSNFKFQLGQEVKLALSEEKGIVRGRAEYSDSVSSYYIQYVAADGRQVTDWWIEPAITDVPEAA